MPNKVLRLGLMSDRSAELDALRAQTRQSVHKVVHSTLLDSVTLPLPPKVDVWLVQVAEHSDELELILEWLDEASVPFMLQDAGGDAFVPHRFEMKLQALAQAHEQDSSAVIEPSRVWVVAASTGGPQAVGDFFEALKALGTATPEAAKCAYIYAQHIDERSIESLRVGLSHRTDFDVCLCEPGVNIEAGKIYIVEPDKQFEVSSAHRFAHIEGGWNGPFSPSINQVIAKVARQFRNRSGAIIFTGMGDDGADSSRLMQALGGRVLVQSFDSCTVDSMPRSAKRLASVEYEGSPQALAKYLG